MTDLQIFTRDQGLKQISRHFKAREFFCKCGQCRNQLIDLNHVARLEILREAFGKPMHINSGFRSEEYNKEIGGSLDSQHCKGTATDITVEGKTPEEIASKAELLGFKGIGIYKTFVHLDSREGASARWEEK